MTGEPTRRGLVAAAAGGSLLLAGCKGLEALGPPPRPAAAVGTLEQAVAAEEQMVRAYRAALAALSGLSGQRAAEVVSDVLADHEAHLLRLRTRLIVPHGQASPRPGIGSGTGSGPGSGPDATPSPSAAGSASSQIIAGLVRAENAAAARLIGQLLTMPPAVAQLMASIGASEAGHAALLSRPGLA